MIDHDNPKIYICLDQFSILAIRIWELIISRNRGSSYRFVLNQLPFAANEIFVDAAST